MRRVTAMVSAAAVVLWAVTAFAQAKPDFNGKWTREAPAAGAAAGGGGGAAGAGGGQRGAGGGGGGGGFACGAACTLTQTATMLKVDRAAADGTAMPTITFMLDGTDSKNAGRAGADGTPTSIISKAKWDGAKLVVSTTRDMQGTAITSTQTLSVEAGKLTVVTNSGREGATPTTATYTKG